MSLVVKREGDGLRRYLHLSTGNYNPATARVYTDLSFFTARPEFCRDASALFNLLTGNASAGEWERFSVSPLDLHDGVLGHIEEVQEAATRGLPASICAKMNALVDGDVIRALYRASQAGAKIDLLVRGICCLKPGVPGVSENIRVRSVVDRFLEHSRIVHFVAGDKDQVFLSSADWMPRNFQRRVEVMWPVEEPALHRRLVRDVLGVMSAPDARALELQPDGTYVPVPPPGTDGYRPQVRFLDYAKSLERSPPNLRPVGQPEPPR